MAMLNDDEKNKFVERMLCELTPLLMKSAVPLYGEQDGKLIQCGTGTLFRVAEHSFLVTASHVAELKTKHRIHLYTWNGIQGSHHVPLAGTVIRSEILDLAIWKLPHEVVSQLQDRVFLTIHHADRANSRPANGLYVVHGYPNCWSQSLSAEKKTVVKPLTLITGRYDGSTESLSGLDLTLHVLLDGEANAGVLPRNVSQPPKLHGISGCSIWQVYYEGLPSSQWTQSDAKVVGVQTGVYKEGKIIKGTRWFLVNAIITKNYPDLKDALSIVTPSHRIVMN